MRPIAKMKRSIATVSLIAILALAGCKSATETESKPTAAPAPVYFKVDPATAGVVEGKIRYTGAETDRHERGTGLR
jgi:uncharacterized lipoprotein NlpE involved in copper resistance